MRNKKVKKNDKDNRKIRNEGPRKYEARKKRKMREKRE